MSTPWRRPRKTGHVFVFDRVNGTPLFRSSTERSGEHDCRRSRGRTQPLPTKPAPFARQLLTADMVTKRTPEAHAAALAQFGKCAATGSSFRRRGRDTVSFRASMAARNGAARPSIRIPACCMSIRTKWSGCTPWPKRKPGMAVSGKDLYARECGSCHREDRTGAPPAIRSLVDIGKRMTVAEVGWSASTAAAACPAFLRWRLITPTRSCRMSETASIKRAHPCQCEAGAVGRAIPIHGTPQVPRHRTVTGDCAALGNAECHQHEHGRICLEDSAWRVSGLVAQGLKDTGARTTATDCHGRRSRIFIAATELRQEVPWRSTAYRQARRKPRFHSRKTRRWPPTRNRRASVHRHCHQRCRQSAGPAQHATPTPGARYIAFALP